MKKQIPLSLVRETIKQLLVDGYPMMEQVARELGVSSRTLQRRLTGAGFTYTQIVQQVRLVRACELLASPEKPISSVAAQTGFSSPSSLSRAFHSWTGITPREFRGRVVLS